MSTRNNEATNDHRTAITLVSPQTKVVSKLDHAIVSISSLFFVGGVVWVPALFIWLYRKWKNTPNDCEENEKKRKRYRNLLITFTVIGVLGPHRTRKFGKIIDFRNWRAFKAVSFFIIILFSMQFSLMID